MILISIGDTEANSEEEGKIKGYVEIKDILLTRRTL